MIHNFSSRTEARRIKVFFRDSSDFLEYDVTLEPHFWAYREFGSDLYKIQVFNEFSDFLYEEYNDETVQNYLQFH